jgi:hypothetical protein
MVRGCAHLAKNGFFRLLIQPQAGAGRFGSSEDDVLHLLHIDLCDTQHLKDARQSANAISMANNQ